jgi:hypothetical protein
LSPSNAFVIIPVRPGHSNVTINLVLSNEQKGETLESGACKISISRLRYVADPQWKLARSGDKLLGSTNKVLLYKFQRDLNWRRDEELPPITFNIGPEDHMEDSGIFLSCGAKDRSPQGWRFWVTFPMLPNGVEIETWPQLAFSKPSNKSNMFKLQFNGRILPRASTNLSK